MVRGSTVGVHLLMRPRPLSQEGIAWPRVRTVGPGPHSEIWLVLREVVPVGEGVTLEKWGLGNPNTSGVHSTVLPTKGRVAWLVPLSNHAPLCILSPSTGRPASLRDGCSVMAPVWSTFPLLRISVPPILRRVVRRDRSTRVSRQREATRSPGPGGGLTWPEGGEHGSQWREPQSR